MRGRHTVSAMVTMRALTVVKEDARIIALILQLKHMGNALKITHITTVCVMNG